MNKRVHTCISWARVVLRHVKGLTDSYSDLDGKTTF